MDGSFQLNVILPLETLSHDIKFGQAGELDVSYMAAALKTALLYADSITCISIATSMIQSFPPLWLKGVEATGPGVEDLEKQRRVRKDFDKFVRAFWSGDPDIRQKVRGLCAQNLTEVAPYRENFPDQWDWIAGPDAREIDVALMSGYVTNGLDIFKLLKSDSPSKDVAKVVNSSLKSTSLFSEPLITNSDPSILSINVADQMLSRIPQIHAASIDEIIDIRKELEPYLTPFRAGIADVAAMVRDRDSGSSIVKEVDFEMQRTVEPVLKEIECAVDSNRYLRRLAENTLGKDLVISGGGGLGAGIATAAGMWGATATSLAAAIGSVVGVGSLLAKTALDVVKESKKIEGNRFYLYYRLKKRWQT